MAIALGPGFQCQQGGLSRPLQKPQFAEAHHDAGHGTVDSDAVIRLATQQTRFVNSGRGEPGPKCWRMSASTFNGCQLLRG